MNTQEFLKEIYKKAKKVAIHKGSCTESEFSHIVLYEDGTLGVIYDVGCRGEYTSEYDRIEFNDLDKTPEQLNIEWKQLIEDRKKKIIQENEARIAREEAEQEKKDYELYMKLKQKYA